MFKSASMDKMDTATLEIAGCQVTAFKKLISGKHKLRILWDLKDGPLRYGELRTGLLSRKDFACVPPKVEYSLIPVGQTFIPIIAAIRNWGEEHLSVLGPV